MAAKANPNKSNMAQIEEQVQRAWESEKTFEESVKQRQGSEYFSFYDGPPFANGLPHYGHALASSIKDAVLRYKTMRGYYVPRRNGWDCHGLPVEFAIEKEFGVSGKKQIEELGLDKFNAACRESIFKYKDEWEVLLKRLGRWSDYENYYATVDSTYTESVWWALSQIHEKGLLYRGFKSTAYCPRCETPLSNFEVNDGYKDNVPDPSLYVKFKLADESTYLLGWTTTPWTLPGNAAIAVKPEADYVQVSVKDDDGGDQNLILAKARLDALSSDNYRIVREFKGSDLVGRSYEPLFKLAAAKKLEHKENLYKVWPADFVSTEDGTGILHVAPAFGEDDLDLGQKNDIPVLKTVDESGKLHGGIGFDEVKGKFFKGADKLIIERLSKMGLVYAAETIEHTYPFCWRCDTPLMYYAISSWFIGVSKVRKELLKTAEEINWVPKNIKNGRFGQWLEGARDWAISRNRYWGAPMPIWVNEKDEDDYLVVDSFDKLRELVSNESLDLSDVHRPFIDQVVIEKDGKTYRRVEEVLDCWFESGCMSVGQLHYPFENKDDFVSTFPADFIIEGLDQTRLWFYVQHVVATILFDKPAFTNVVVNGMITAADGQKLSKRLKNYPPIEEVFDDEGADSLRLFLLSSTQATETADYMRFNRDALKDLNRNVLGTLMNSVKFFSTYAEIDDFKPVRPGSMPKSNNPMDQWILARLDETVSETTKSADTYRIAHAIKPVFDLIDDMSNWYIRRSRRRFWKSEDDADKNQAYEVLWFVLNRTCQLLAPWAPFISDHIWRQLNQATSLPKSVHLTDWPEPEKYDDNLLKEMASVRDYINQGLSIRGEAKIKVRQPLASLVVPKVSDDFVGIIKDEVNVHEVKFGRSVELDTDITDDLKREGLMRDIVRQIQNARKQADLNVEDRILLSIASDDEEVNKAISEHEAAIKTETLAKDLKPKSDYSFKSEVSVDGHKITISLQKA